MDIPTHTTSSIKADIIPNLKHLKHNWLSSSIPNILQMEESTDFFVFFNQVPIWLITVRKREGGRERERERESEREGEKNILCKISREGTNSEFVFN